MPETIRLQREGAIVTVTLDRPEVRNAFNARMIAELTGAFRSLGTDEEVRAVVLAGEGKTFSAGADIDWMRASLDFTREENVADALRMSDMFAAMNDLPQPLIARVHGAALGGGMGLMAVCDIVVAAEDTVFGFTEARLGILPAVISRFVVPKIGPGWARALFLTAERFDVATARSAGLVHWIAPADQLDAAVRRRIDDVLAGGPLAVRAAKCLIGEIEGQPDDAVRTLTANRIAELRASPEGQEGLRAFLEKRPAVWRAG